MAPLDRSNGSYRRVAEQQVEAARQLLAEDRRMRVRLAEMRGVAAAQRERLRRRDA
jgi:hypothetical protein